MPTRYRIECRRHVGGPHSAHLPWMTDGQETFGSMTAAELAIIERRLNETMQTRVVPVKEDLSK